MSEESLPKYRVVQHSTFATFIEKVNTLAEAGYGVHTFEASQNDWIAYMSRKSDSKYENITNLKDVPPSEVDDYLAQGWIVSDSYSKFIRMVKPGDIHEECPDCDNCERIDLEGYEPTYNEGMI